MKISNLFLL